ncbi:MAG: glycine cleavage system protein GcvH [Dermatophilaceae bacterium]
MSELSYPDDLRYTTDHEWVRISDGVRARVGITAYAQNALGDVVYVSMPQVGQALVAGESCGEVESTKSVSDVYAPLGGDVTAVNEALDTTPELVNSDPYGEGWMFEMAIADDGELEGLMDAEGYREILGDGQ